MKCLYKNLFTGIWEDPELELAHYSQGNLQTSRPNEVHYWSDPTTQGFNPLTVGVQPAPALAKCNPLTLI